MRKLKYVINTIEHYDLALKILHKSLIENGIDPKDMIYVYAGVDRKGVLIKKNDEDITCIYVPYNLFEFTSIFGILYLMLKDNEYLNYNYLFLHDTCKALRGFKEKSLEMNKTCNQTFDICWAHTAGRHNIGIFSPKAILKSYDKCLKPIIEKEVPFDKTYAVQMEWDHVPESLRNIPVSQWFPHDGIGIVLTPFYIKSEIYSKDKPRDIAFLTSLNLIKYYFLLGPIRPYVGYEHPQAIL